ncbi:MAG: hypothetical protein JWO95_3566, partial [Verrucomicrobiales bacterium]|nr:hypothetical protein [Verrucomicrobiales bacterium]
QLILNKTVYWIDATADYQRGPLATRYLPDFERGLVLRPKTVALAVIPQSSGQSRTVVTEQFQIQFRDQPSQLKVVTVADGEAADALRAQLASTPRPQLEKAYLNYYAKRYPDISQIAPISISDDEDQNKIEITELYSVPNIWLRSSEEQHYHCEFQPTDLGRFIKPPAVPVRTMPLAVGFPANHVFRIEATLPAIWSFQFENKVIEDNAFRLRRTVTGDARKFVLQYEYSSLTDSVPAERTAQYLRHLDEASQILPYWLTGP